MKNIIICLLLLSVSPVYAANMCVKNDAVVVVFDSRVGGTALANSETGKTWSTQFSYGIISGIGSCGTAVSGLAVGGAPENQTPYSPTAGGNNCFCKMLRPVESKWVWGAASSYSSCPSTCASNCSTLTASSVAVRSGMFTNLIQ